MTYLGDHRIYYYIDSKGKEVVKEYIDKLSKKEQVKVFTYLELLKDKKGYLDEPYSKHIKGKIRELRVGFSKNHHRIFYFTFVSKKIILLHAFLKKTSKTPKKEIIKAEKNYRDFLINNNKYD
ncbi:type II toxin-antitoxin system RelE/ParE family toxin [Patescibacteria group bacterium]|nr:type II toxin-antitoxin system RelE/ParE family toxin [Patescibacteria group bacterium]MBU4162067.1 type II toxin-antitoxin system RelE/ParE family toxin [Patescibacteria group bacterium]